MTCPKCSATMTACGTYCTCTMCSYHEVRRDYRIRDERLAAFEERMTKLARRAVRIGVEPPSYVKGAHEDVTEIERNELSPRFGKPTGRVRRFWPVTIAGEAPRFAGWTFAATLQHLGEANIIRAIGGEVPEQYRDAGPACDHCRQARQRKGTYLVRHDDGTVRQIGSSCLADFLGHESPAELAADAEYLVEALAAGEEGEGGGGGGMGAYLYTVESFVTFCAAAIREHGWISRAAARERDGLVASTADIAYASMTGRDRDPLVPTDEDRSRAVKALAWARALGDDGAELSDYEHNLRTVARCTVLPERADGIAASIIAACERIERQAAERAAIAATSAYVGTVGERIVLTLTILAIVSVESMYGVKHLHIMADATGNRLTWFCTGDGIGARGDTVTVKATVKKHETYKGVAQTVLSRAVVYVAPVKKARRGKATAAA